VARLNKPTHLKLVEGNPGKRALNTNEPEPDFLNDLTPPEHLPVWAVNIWNDLAPKLRASNVLTVLDAECLAQLCVAIAQYREATHRLNLDFINGGEKGQSLNQMMVAQSMAFKQANSIMQQFGMTPVARTRVVVNSKGDLFGKEKTGTDYLS